MEICTVLLAVIMVFFGYKEYCLKEQMEYNMKREQMNAEQVNAENDLHIKVPVKEQEYAVGQMNGDGQERQTETEITIRVLLKDNNQDTCMQQVILQSSGKITVSGAKSCMFAPDTPFDVSTLLAEGEVVSV